MTKNAQLESISEKRKYYWSRNFLSLGYVVEYIILYVSNVMLRGLLMHITEKTDVLFLTSMVAITQNSKYYNKHK